MVTRVEWRIKAKFHNVSAFIFQNTNYQQLPFQLKYPYLTSTLLADEEKRLYSNLFYFLEDLFVIL